MFIIWNLDTEREIETSKMNSKENVDLLSVASRSRKDVTEKLSLFQREVFKKMKSITDASDDVCVTMLSKTGFKLNDSIELFYRGDQ